MSATATATVRLARAEDETRVRELVHAFLDATPYGTRISGDPAHFDAGIRLLYDRSHLMLAEADGRVVGLIAVIVSDHPLTGRRAATELVWWVDEADRRSGAGFALLEAAEAWARGEGADMFEAAEHSDDAVMQRLYRRAGYRVREVIYEKDLQS